MSHRFYQVTILLLLVMLIYTHLHTQAEYKPNAMHDVISFPISELHEYPKIEMQIISNSDSCLIINASNTTGTIGFTHILRFQNGLLTFLIKGQYHDSITNLNERVDSVSIFRLTHLGDTLFIDSLKSLLHNFKTEMTSSMNNSGYNISVLWYSPTTGLKQITVGSATKASPLAFTFNQALYGFYHSIEDDKFQSLLLNLGQYGFKY